MSLPFLIWACSHEPGAEDMRVATDTPDSYDLPGGSCPRRLLEGEVTNARELGGQLLGQSVRVGCGQIVRGGDLCRLSSAGCTQFAELGIKTVIDLRGAGTQQASPAASCAVAQASVVSAALPKLLPDTPANYLALMEEKEAISSVFAALGEQQNFPVYIHCVIGRDRASFITALILLALGADHQAVIDEFMLSGAAGIAVKEPCIKAILDEIQSRGGIESFLGSCGVTPAQIDNLRTQVRAE